MVRGLRTLRIFVLFLLLLYPEGYVQRDMSFLTLSSWISILVRDIWYGIYGRISILVRDIWYGIYGTGTPYSSIFWDKYFRIISYTWEQDFTCCLYGLLSFFFTLSFLQSFRILSTT